MKKNFNPGLGKSVEADRAKLSRRRRQILRELGLSEELDSTELAEGMLVQAKANSGTPSRCVRNVESHWRWILRS
jgi:hypothetical protein